MFKPLLPPWYCTLYSYLSCLLIVLAGMLLLGRTGVGDGYCNVTRTGDMVDCCVCFFFLRCPPPNPPALPFHTDFCSPHQSIYCCPQEKEAEDVLLLLRLCKVCCRLSNGAAMASSSSVFTIRTHITFVASFFVDCVFSSMAEASSLLRRGDIAAIN